MIGKTPMIFQIPIFEVAVERFYDMNHELVLLSKQLGREVVERIFAKYFCAEKMRPSVLIRNIVG